MLRVRVEVVPWGDERLAQEIGRVEIANQGQVTAFPTFHEYTVSLWDGPGNEKSGVFRHARSDGWAECLRRALDAALEERGD